MENNILVRLQGLQQNVGKKELDINIIWNEEELEAIEELNEIFNL